MRRAIACLLLLLATPAAASIEAMISDGKPVAFRGNKNKDTISVSPKSRRLFAVDNAQTVALPVTVTLQAETTQPITVIAYDYNLREVGRARSVGGTAEFDAVFGSRVGFLRVVPTGSTYDTPVGSKLRERIDIMPGDTAVLPAYRLSVGPAAATGPSSPTVVAASAPSRDISEVARQPGEQTARFVPFRKPATERPDAAVAATVAKPVNVKRWGALAGMIGSHWRSQFQVYSIDWDRPGEAIRIGVDGLLGEAETLIVADADGKSLRYVYSKPASATRYDERIAVDRGKSFVLHATSDGSTVCVIAKGAVLNCTDRKKVRDKRSEQIVPMTRVDAAQAQAIVAAFPDRFPGRPPGRFDPQFGMLAEMADRRWTEDPKPSAYSASELFEFGGTPQGRALITRVRGQFGGARVVYLQANGPGALNGSYYAGTVDSPNAMASVSLTVDAEGVANLCSTDGCDQWRMSRDGKLALRMRSENGGWTPTIFRPVPVPVAGSTGSRVLDLLHDKTYLAPNGRSLSFKALPNSFSMTLSWSRGDRVSNGCYTTANPDVAECFSSKGVTRKGLPFVRQESGFSVDGYSYVLRGDRIVQRSEQSNEELVFNRSSAGLVELDFHADDDRRDQTRLRRENRRQTADRARREREMLGAIMGAAQAIGGALAGGSNPSTFTPTYRSNSGSVSQPPGYAAMGTTSFTAMPMASQEYIRQQDELERFRIREQLYGSAPRTTERPYAKAYEQLARDNADREARNTDLLAQIDASREQEARAFAAGPSGDRGGSGASAPTPDAAQHSRLDREATAQRDAAEVERRRVAQVEADASKRRQDEIAAQAEKARQERIAADAERTRKAEITARERLPVAWKEGVVLCEPPKSGNGEWTCHGPLQTTYGVPDKPSGAIAVRQACGGGTVRELGQAGGFRTYGCGFGTSPLNAPSRDPATRFGVFVPGRAKFMCPRNQPGVCTSN